MLSLAFTLDRCKNLGPFRARRRQAVRKPQIAGRAGLRAIPPNLETLQITTDPRKKLRGHTLGRDENLRFASTPCVVKDRPYMIYTEKCAEEEHTKNPNAVLRKVYWGGRELKTQINL